MASPRAPRRDVGKATVSVTMVKKIRLLAILLIAALVFSGIAILPLGLITRVQPLVISGGSMEPAYRIGDVVLVRRSVESSQIEVGDAVTYVAQNGTLVTHRVDAVFVREQGIFWRTVGDANDAPDPNLVFEGQLRGKVIGRVPMGGAVTLVYTNQAARTFLFLAPLLILAAPWLRKLTEGSYGYWRRTREPQAR